MYGDKPKSGTAGCLAFILIMIFMLGLLIVWIAFFTEDKSARPKQNQTGNLPNVEGENPKSSPTNVPQKPV